jgi:hypothetical protein
MAKYINLDDPEVTYYMNFGRNEVYIVGEEAERIDIVRCRDCIYYDAPHVEKDGERYEYADMPEDAFDAFGEGVHSGYGINVGGRCLRSKAKLARGKSIFMDEDDYCSKGERRADERVYSADLR